MAIAPMQFSFTTGGRARRVEPEDPFRMLVLARLSGHASSRDLLSQRKPLRIDLDNFDAQFRRLAPCLRLTLDDSPLLIEFQSLEDFHPDRLFARLPQFAALRQLRAELADPAKFRQAADSLGASAAASGVAATNQSGDTAQADDMERLLGRKPAAAPAAGSVDGRLDGWLRRVVAPHVLPDIANEQAQLIAAVDASIAAQMRRVLHHPDFQALEANWRGVEQLVRGLELGDGMVLLLLDCAREELVQDVSDHASDLSGSALHRLLCAAPEQAPDDARWSLLVTDLSFGASLADLQLLAALGALAGRAGAPLLAAAQPALLGCGSVAQLADAKAWQALPEELGAYWTALRQSPVAAWLGLALPRVLLRPPYGKASDPISAFAFEELVVREHQDYLWGSAAWALALLAGQAFMEQAWDMELATGAELDDLPSHVFLADGEKQQQACAELLLSEAAGDAVLRHGPMVLLSYRQRNAVRLLRWQSLAEPSQALRGAWD